jgi:hypothetical protein
MSEDQDLWSTATGHIISTLADPSVLQAAIDPELDVLLATHGPVGAIVRRAESAILGQRRLMHWIRLGTSSGL